MVGLRVAERPGETPDRSDEHVLGLPDSTYTAVVFSANASSAIRRDSSRLRGEYPEEREFRLGSPIAVRTAFRRAAEERG